jgi:DNA polymerase-3 subunit gamma/tau
MAYKALYRTYRPSDFSEIAGQEHIVRTFQNALKNNKIAHAYLFSGPRGTGKTSIAKIIAKAVNCEHAPTENPCNECDICKGIDDNTISDVIEIDAASNNGVDEIREIRDKVKYLPGVAKYKVYIIDEVHMLSTGAFNALLKTLEEPPKHVIFILATTEPHKIPATIHSRCQRFDFRGVSIKDMIKRMNIIIKEEQIDITKEAVRVIAENAEGGMRDAISLLDQLVSYTNQTITVNDIHAIRGSVSSEHLIEITEAIYHNDAVKAIQIMDELIAMGKETPRLVENLIHFYRDMLLFKNTAIDNDEQSLFANAKFKELSKKLSNNVMFYYVDVLSKAQQDMKWTNNAKIYLEVALMKMVDPLEKRDVQLMDDITMLKQDFNSLKQELLNEINQQAMRQEQSKTKEDEKQETTSALNQQYEFTNSLFENLPEIESKTNQDEEVETYKAKVRKDTETLIESEDIKIEDKIETQAVDQDSPYSTYDIRYVEEVLNNGNREIKIQMNKQWFDIERFAGPELLPYAKWITSGRIVATNGKMVIIEYANASLCNRMMKPSTKEIVTDLLSKFYNRDLDYLALPKEVWEQKSQEFIKIWKENKDVGKDEYIKLSPIIHPGLKEIPQFEEEESEFTSETVKEAKKIFGPDIVKVTKGGKL